MIEKEEAIVREGVRGLKAISIPAPRQWRAPDHVVLYS